MPKRCRSSRSNQSSSIMRLQVDTTYPRLWRRGGLCGRISPASSQTFRHKHVHFSLCIHALLYLWFHHPCPLIILSCFFPPILALLPIPLQQTYVGIEFPLFLGSFYDKPVQNLLHDASDQEQRRLAYIEELKRSRMQLENELGDIDIGAISHEGSARLIMLESACANVEEAMMRLQDHRKNVSLTEEPLEALKEALSQHAATLQDLQVKSEQLDNALTGGQNLPKIVAAWRHVRQDLTSIVINFQARVYRALLSLLFRHLCALIILSCFFARPCPPTFPSATGYRWNRISSKSPSRRKQPRTATPCLH